MPAKIVSCFPGVGRREYLLKHKDDDKKIVNLSVTDFSMITDSKATHRNPDFPGNYIEAIRSHMEDADVILIDSTKIVLERLAKKHIKFTVVFPATDPDTRNDFKHRWSRSFHDDEFIRMMREHVVELVNDIRKMPFPEKIELHKDQYLSTVLD